MKAGASVVFTAVILNVKPSLKVLDPYFNLFNLFNQQTNITQSIEKLGLINCNLKLSKRLSK